MQSETPIRYRALEMRDAETTCAMVARVFRQFIAPEYAPEGVAEFLRFADPAALRARLQSGNFGRIAEAGTKMAGMIEVRDHSHITMLFVAIEYQRRGIAAELWRQARAECRRARPGITEFTVNSSPYAVPVYERLGFRAVGPFQVVHSIRFMPMACKVHEADNRPYPA